MCSRISKERREEQCCPGQGTVLVHVLFRSAKERGTESSAVAPGHKSVERTGKAVLESINW